MIHVLDQKTIDKIAAGEVIERPASVVKELVENSIDAGAGRVTVEIRDGGTTMIRVTDNGEGIPAEEVRTAFLRHATSKLETAEELVGIGTLGFRGEALSTISAVTQTEMITKTPTALTGIKYVIHGGTEMECTEIGAPDGTTIICRNIFYNTPARLKFLKTNMTEGSYINDLMSHIALSHPEVSVTLISNGKTIVDTSGNGNLKDTIYTLYGRDITGSLLPVDYTEGGLRLTGFIGKPFLARGNRSFENYFVNSRYIKSPVINRAIEEAYKTYIMQHRFPFTVLFLELPKEECDVNVHPTKREFKYQNEKALFSAVYHAVEDALREKTLIPDAATDYGTREKSYTAPKTAPQKPTTQSPMQQRPVAESAVQQKPVTESAVQQKFVTEDPMSQNSASAFVPADQEGSKGQSTPDTSAGGSSGSASRPYQPQGKPSMVQERQSYGSRKSGGSYSILEALMPKDFRDQLKEQQERKAAAAEEQQAKEVQTAKQEQEKYQQAALTDASYLSEEAGPDVRIIGQVFNTYWITQYGENLYYMDQHAAHEKVNYERFLKEFRERTIHSQQIFPPKLITLSGPDKEAVLSSMELFEKAGFELSDFGGNEIKLSALPSNLLGLSGEEVFLEFAAYLSSGVSGVTEDIFVHKLATMGCKSAIKGNQRITVQEAEQLLKELMTLDNPYTCPHGRPTMIRLTREELDKRFKRIVE